MNIEPCEWARPGKVGGRPPSALLVALVALQVGECIRVRHEDGPCGAGKCRVSRMIPYLNEKGRRYQYYHEAPHVAVVRRVS